MNQLCVRKNEDYCLLRYEIEPNMLEGDSIVIPSSTLNMHFDIKINGNSLQQRDGGNLLEAISFRLLQSEIWAQLDYQADLFVTEECSLTVRLGCNIFNSIRGSIVPVPRSELAEVRVSYEVLTPSDMLPMSAIVGGFNYLFASLLLNLEYKMPFVFSFYGRRFFKQNYNWAVRNLEEVRDVKGVRVKSETQQAESAVFSLPSQSHEDGLCLLFERLQRKMLREFNTLNVWKEAELLNYRPARTTQKEQTTSQAEQVSVKSLTYSIVAL